MELHGEGKSSGNTAPSPAAAPAALGAVLPDDLPSPCNSIKRVKSSLGFLRGLTLLMKTAWAAFSMSLAMESGINFCTNDLRSEVLTSRLMISTILARIWRFWVD